MRGSLARLSSQEFPEPFFCISKFLNKKALKSIIVEGLKIARPPLYIYNIKMALKYILILLNKWPKTTNGKQQFVSLTLKKYYLK